MTSTFKPYPKYKPSGVEWLGDIPENWKLHRLKRAVCLINEKAVTEKKPLSLENIEGGTGKLIPTESSYEGSGVAFESNDILFGKLRPYLAKVHLATDAGSALGDIYVFRAKQNILPQFIHSTLISAGFIRTVNSTSDGAKMPRAGWDVMSLIKVPIPNPSEQTAIANFLDSETAKIDETIKELEASVELLNEEKISLINEYVTGKINPETGKPYPKYKPSGVEWLGDIPEHWTKEPLRHCLNYQEGPGIMAVDFLDEGIPLLRIAGVQCEWATLEGCNYLDPEKVKRKWNHFRLEEGDLLISGSATMGTVTEVNSETIGAVPYTGLIRLRGEDSKMIKLFIKFIVISSVFMTQIDLLKAGATIQHFGPTHLGQMFVVRPPVSEQEVIVSFLKDSCFKVDSLTSEKQSLIETLKEYRTSLIHEAVTGKINLRAL